VQLQSFSEEETAAAAFGVFLAGRRASAGSRRWKMGNMSGILSTPQNVNES